MDGLGVVSLFKRTEVDVSTCVSINDSSSFPDVDGTNSKVDSDFLAGLLISTIMDEMVFSTVGIGRLTRWLLVL